MNFGQIKKQPEQQSLRVRFKAALWGKEVDVATTTDFAIEFVRSEIEDELRGNGELFGKQSEEFFRGYQAAIEIVRKFGDAK